jgi:TusA-related sulfurtransferase
MKVKTDLRAGTVLDELSTDASQVYETIQSWLNQQGNRVNDYTDAQIARAKNLFNCILKA